jgi:hypothetical protein
VPQAPGDTFRFAFASATDVWSLPPFFDAAAVARAFARRRRTGRRWRCRRSPPASPATRTTC